MKHFYYSEKYFSTPKQATEDSHFEGKYWLGE